MTERSNELDGFLEEVCETVEHDVAADEVQPDFEAMLARASELNLESPGFEDGFEESFEAPQQGVGQDEALTGFVSEVSTHLANDLEDSDDPVPDFLAVVSRAHALAPNVIPQSAVDDVGQYAPIISLKHAGRLRTGQHDVALDTFVGDVRGHVDQELVREGSAASDEAANDTKRRGGFGLAIAAGLVLALGLGAGLATVFDLGGGLWSLEADAPSEAMLSPHPTAEQESQLAGGAANGSKRLVEVPPPVLEPDSEATALETPPDAPVEVAPAPGSRRRSKAPAKPASRRDRLAALEQDANAAWRAGKLDKAESTFRKIIALDGRGSWGESAYGELFTLQRQRGRSSVALWKAYLKRFPKGRFADDARAGLCRRAGDDSKAACWTAYLEAMPRGSFRAQAQRELESARGKDTP